MREIDLAKTRNVALYESVVVHDVTSSAKVVGETVVGVIKYPGASAKMIDVSSLQIVVEALFDAGFESIYPGREIGLSNNISMYSVDHFSFHHLLPNIDLKKGDPIHGPLFFIGGVYCDIAIVRSDPKYESLSDREVAEVLKWCEAHCVNNVSETNDA